MKNESLIKLCLDNASAQRFASMVIAMFLMMSVLNAQSEVSSAGGDGSGSGGTVAFTIGQVAYTNVEAEDGTISMGVQQPNLFLTVGVHEAVMTFSASVFPNPVNETTSLKLEGKDITQWGDGLTYRLYDSNGKLILQKPVESELTTIPMQHLASDVYFLQITQKDLEIKSFKIFKTN